MFRIIPYLKPLTSLLALLLASFAFTKWGYIWYATAFDDLWQSLIGQTEDELIKLAESRGKLQTFFTYFISFVQAAGLMIMLKLTRVRSFIDYQFVAAVISVLIVSSALGNAVLFTGQSTQLWYLDILHFILGYAGMALTFWLIYQVAPIYYQLYRGKQIVARRLKLFNARYAESQENMPWITKQRHRLRGL